ncbi:MAG: DUF1223 domain-containing protein [Vulcanimicrobiota bacterium]
MKKFLVLLCLFSTPALADGVAVIELFTSQGCSSCPSADRLVSELGQDPRVFTLSFHVDYWNRLGWVDPFSRPEYTERQKAYSRHFKQRNIYTPQAVVNGRWELVGSNRAGLESYLKQAFQSPATALKLGSRVEKGKLFVTVEAPTLKKAKQLNLALVTPHAQTAVERGENSGRRLEHTNVVRAFKQVTLAKPAQQFSLELPNLKGLQLVAYFQDGSGAASLDI